MKQDLAYMFYALAASSATILLASSLLLLSHVGNSVPASAGTNTQQLLPF